MGYRSEVVSKFGFEQPALVIEATGVQGIHFGVCEDLSELQSIYQRYTANRS